jgi:hypothetical protein
MQVGQLEGRHVDPSRPWQLDPVQARGRVSGGIASVIALAAASLLASFAQSQSHGFAIVSLILWIVIAFVVLMVVLLEIVTILALIRARELRKRFPGIPVYFSDGSADFLRSLLGSPGLPGC